MTDRPVLIPTAEGAVGGIVSEPEGEARGAMLLLGGYGRPARSGINSFWTRTARSLAARGLVVLRVDYSREGETLPIGEGGSGLVWKRDLDLRLLSQVAPWFRARAGGMPLLLAGSCSGARLAIELAGREPHSCAGTFLVVPYIKDLGAVERHLQGADDGGVEPGLPGAVDPLVVDCLRRILIHAPSWVLVGEGDDPDLTQLRRRVGSTPHALETEVVPGVALHLLDQPHLQRDVGRRLLTRVVSVARRLTPEPRGVAPTASRGRLALADEVRRRLGQPPDMPEWPLVSIVVLNRDGVEHLRRLLPGLVERTDYPHLELILVDNDSRDESLDYVRSVEAPFPISILANAHNESFSDACNQGAELASGELLLFLNNDTEPFEPGWLRELVACHRTSGAGAVGATLIQPDPATGSSCGFVVQQRGLLTEEWGKVLAPSFRDRGADPLDARLGEDTECIAVTAACVLVGRRPFEAVGGFSRGYVYGAEDIDLSLKLRERGRRVVCSGRSLLVHLASSTLGEVAPRQHGSWVRGNRRLFWERWGPRARREFQLDRREGRGLWTEAGLPAPGEGTREPPRPASDGAGLEALAYCLKAAVPAALPGWAGADPHRLLGAIRTELLRRGHRCLAAYGADVEDLGCLNYDVAVHLSGPVRYVLKPAQLNVLWIAAADSVPPPIERDRYDLVLTPSARPAGAATPEELVDALTEAVEARAGQLGFRTMIAPGEERYSTRSAARAGPGEPLDRTKGGVSSS